MREIQLNSRVIPQLNKLSESMLGILLNVSRSFGRVSVKIGRSVNRQVRFLRQFNYSKEAIQQHLIDKASAFFGFTWVEDHVQSKPKNRKFSTKLSNRIRHNRVGRVEDQATKTIRATEKTKKMSKNLYRAP